MIQKTENVGGQAVIEGVMMRAPGCMAVAVRTPDGGMALRKDRLKPRSRGWRFLRWPLLRGTVVLFSSLALGFRALSFSADQALEGEGGEPVSGFAMGATVAVSAVLGVALFFYLPLLTARLAEGSVPLVRESPLAFNLLDGLVRVVLFLAYILGISRMKDIRRVFEYHGAEHKAIYAYEAGGELTVGRARGFSTLHPRCGTSFLLVVMVVSIAVFSLVPKGAPFYVKAASRLVLLPVIAGLSYEFTRFSAGHMDNPLVAALVKPGLWLQRLTTREPSDDQIEVALRALSEAVGADGGMGEAEVSPCLRS